MKKILSYIIPLLFIPLIAYAAGKAYPPSANQTLTPIAGVTDDGTIVGLKASSDGELQSELVAGTEIAVTNPDGSNVGSLTSVTVTGSANGNGQSAVTAIDVSAYKTISLQTSGTFSLTHAFQCSNDNVNWVACGMQNIASVPLAENTTVTGVGTGIYVASVNSKYFRDQVTAYTSGTINTTLVLSTLAGAPPTQPVWAGQDGSWVVSKTSDYPAGATAFISSSGNVSNASAVATLAGAANRTTYISGFEITSTGSTAAAVVTVTVTGIQGGTMSYTYATVAGVTSLNSPLMIPFITPIPASGQNVAIAVTLPALGAGNTNATVVAHGYQL